MRYHINRIDVKEPVMILLQLIWRFIMIFEKSTLHAENEEFL